MLLTPLHMLNDRQKYNCLPLTDTCFLFFVSGKTIATNNSFKILKELSSEVNGETNYPPEMNVCIANGQIFMRVNNNLYQFDGNNTKLVRAADNIGSFNEELLVGDFNFASSPSVFTQNHEQPIPSQLQNGGYMTCWCDKLIRTNYENVSIVNADYSQTVITVVSNNCYTYPFFQGGIHITGNNAGTYLLIDCFSLKHYESKLAQLERQQVLSQYQLHSCGLTLGDRILLQIMGKHDLGVFLTNRELYIKEWQRKKFSHKNFPLKQINEFLKSTGQDLIEIEKINFKQYFNQYINIQQKQKNQLVELIKSEREKQLTLLDKLVALKQNKDLIFQTLQKMLQ